MSIFSRVINLVGGLVLNIFKRKAKASEILSGLWAAIPEILSFWNNYKGMDAAARVREFWEEFDYRTGIEGVDVIRDLPQEIEERIFDGLKMAGVELSLYAIGYYTNGERPDAGELRKVGDYVGRALGADLHIALDQYARDANAKEHLTPKRLSGADSVAGSDTSSGSGSLAGSAPVGDPPAPPAPPAPGSTMRKGPQLD